MTELGRKEFDSADPFVRPLGVLALRVTGLLKYSGKTAKSAQVDASY